jgi:WD repeat-containing protein 35
MLDELLMRSEQPNRDFVVDFETKTLREARELIVSKGLNAGHAFADKIPHPRLWRLLAHVNDVSIVIVLLLILKSLASSILQAAIEDLDFAMAERAFVRCGDYYGVQLTKQLRSMPDKMKVRTSV